MDLELEICTWEYFEKNYYSVVFAAAKSFEIYFDLDYDYSEITNFDFESLFLNWKTRFFESRFFESRYFVAVVLKKGFGLEISDLDESFDYFLEGLTY